MELLWAAYEKDVNTKLSSLEREDLEATRRPKEIFFHDMAPFAEGAMSAFLASHFPTLSAPGPEEPALQVLILASSALRVLEIIRKLVPLKTRIAKLFARHMKVNEQIEALSKGHFRIGVGTPARINKIIEEKPALFNNVATVILDQWIDSKKQTLLSLKDTRKDVWWYWDHYLAKRCFEEKTRIALI